MLETISWKGYFYTPENPSEELPGILTFSQEEGVDVELFGQFSNYKNPTSKDENILLGFTSNGKRVTLMNCYEYSRGMSMPGFPTSSFSATYLLVGKQFHIPENISFDECYIEYKDFNYWLKVSGFDKPIFNEAKKETILRYVQPDKLLFNVKPGWLLEIEFMYRRPWEYFKPLDHAGITQEPALILKPTQRSRLHQFEKIYGTFNSLIAMGYYAYPIIQSITFYIEKEPEEEILLDQAALGTISEIKSDIESQPTDEDSKSKKQFDRISLYYKTGLNYKKYKDHHDRHDFLFRYQTYQHQFPQLIQKWYELKDKIDVTIDAQTEWFMDRDNTTEANFISLTQALENMHRKLKRKPKFIFQQRITAMIDILPPRLNTAILNGEKEFTTRVTNNRNYYTHFIVRGEFIPASLSELWVLTQKLKLILLAALLLETGFIPGQVEAMILKKGMYLFNHIIDTSNMEEYLRKINEVGD